MASTPLKDNRDSLKKQLFTHTTDMSEDDSTVGAGSNRSRNDAVEQEICVKWQLPGKIDQAAAKRQLVQLLTTLLISFPERICLIDHKQREWDFQEQVEEERFLQEFGKASLQVHAVKNRQKETTRWISITKLRTTTTIADWKDNDYVFSLMSSMSTYVFPHPFEPDEWDISSIGFIKGVHAVHVQSEEYHHHLCQVILSDNPNDQIPRFHLVPQRITTADRKSSPKAFTIQCPRAEVKKLSYVLTHGTFRLASEQMFVPFRYKTTKPDIYRNCI